MEKEKKSLSESDVVTRKKDFIDGITNASKKGITTLALALALTGTPAMLTSCSDNSDLTRTADPEADRHDVGNYDVGTYQDSYDYGNYDTSDSDVSTVAD